MHAHTITFALAVGIAALAPAGAPAQPREPVTPGRDLRSADARDASQTAQARQDLRPPDARDVAMGRGTSNSPRVVVVRLPQSSPDAPSSAHGLDWGDAGIGAGGLLALGLVGLGGASVVVHRRRSADHAPAAM